MVHLRKMVAFVVAAIMIVTIAVPGYAGASSGGGQNDPDAKDASALYQKIIDAEAAWMASLPLDNGAIPTYSKPIASYSGKYKVIPYFSHIALLGLLEKPEYSYVVKDYMDWYFAHLNEGKGPDAPDGSVYDYVVETDRATETATNDFDSTDSYASTFLNVLRKYAEVTGDTAYVADHKKEILLIASAMMSTQEADGLTWAKPTHKVKYLMDNTEVYKGLKDMEWIAEHIFADAAEASRFKALKEQVHTAIQSGLWLENKKMYSPGKTDTGSLLNPDWQTFYADATAQIFPIWTGIIAPDSERALQLYNTFNEHHPGWPTLDKSDAFPWAMIAYTAALMGDKVRVDQFLQSIEAAYVDQDHPWPWYVMESGLTMLTAAEMQKLAEEPAQFALSSLQEGDVIAAMPYEVTGTASGLDDIEIIFTHQLTGEKKTFHGAPAAGAWKIGLQGLVNGDYQVQVNATDRFNNIHFTHDLAVAVQLGAAGESMAKVTIKAERELLRRNDSTSIVIEAFNKDGKRLDLSDAQIVYHMDRQNLLVPDGANRFTLRGLPLDQAVNQIRLWAFVTKGNDVLKTDELAIGISREAATKQDEMLDSLAGWLAGQQLKDGALTLNDMQNVIDPAAANIAALGLLLRPETIELAERYMTDYVGSWNWGDRFGVYGTKYEMKLDEQSGSWVSTEDYRSAAATIASFITLQRAYYERTGKLAINQYQLDVLTGGLGLMALQGADGLMAAKKGGQVKALQDNLLALQGMKDSVWLFQNHFESADPAAYFSNYAEMLRKGIEEKLWNEETKQYAMSLDAAGQSAAADWSKWEDAAAQLTAIAAGVVAPDSGEAEALYAAVNKSFPEWASADSLSGRHGIAAYVATLMGDADRAMASLTRLSEALKAGKLPADWNVASAGYSMLAAQAVKELVKAVDKSQLEALIAQANQLHDQAQEGSSAGNYPAGSKSQLKAAIAAAEAVLNDETAQQAAVDAAVTALEQAVESFKKLVKAVDKSQLEVVIAQANQLHDQAQEGSSAGNYPAGSKSQLKAAIAAAEAVLDDETARQAAVDAAVTALEQAVESFKKSVHVSVDPPYYPAWPAAADKTSLNQAIADAKAKLDAAVEGSEPGQYKDGAKKALQAAIEAAVAVQQQLYASEQQVSEAEAALKRAVAEFMKQIVAAEGAGAGEGLGGKETSGFKDMQGHWADEAVAGAVKLGIVKGFTDGTFRPNLQVTREQFVTMLARALQLPSASDSADGKADRFKDADRIAAWAKSSVAAAFEAKLVYGAADGTFGPDQAVTRVQLAVLAARAAGLDAAAADALTFADAGQIPAWAKAEVASAAAAGLMQGKGAGRFDPLATATRAEAVKVIIAVLEKVG
ncbi:S-layer homology domain-containing protein [Paenibacillus sp. GCM10027626]|uniref:S-layer homology domain-containing protein n=1 Tax=Paenibacillus sp. GCM10027626 TaxID=3273411 RepID=UPI003633636D